MEPCGVGRGSVKLREEPSAGPRARQFVLLVRHGETAANERGVISGGGEGSEDPGLSVRGARKALLLGKALRELGIERWDAVACSPLRRARETTRLLLEGQGLEDSVVQVEQALCEMRYGRWEGRELSKVGDELRAISRRWAQGDLDECCPGGGESPRDVLRRSLGALSAITAAGGGAASSSDDAVEEPMPARYVLVVAHARVNMVLCSHLRQGGQGLRDMHLVRQENCCANLLCIDGAGEASVEFVNAKLFDDDDEVGGDDDGRRSSL
jgi:broad specificity phosphatase PhoE